MRPPGGLGRVTLPVPAGASSGWRREAGRGPESHDGAGRGVPLWSARWISRRADGGWRVATVRPVRLRGRVAADGVSNVTRKEAQRIYGKKVSGRPLEGNDERRPGRLRCENRSGAEPAYGDDGGARALSARTCPRPRRGSCR
ncbi:hypothetical protein GCM10027073_48670 [Streptomyces chlorus]